jgi:hypothetical protein
VAVTDASGADLTPWHPVAKFEVLGPSLDPSLPGVMRLSPVYVDARWDEAEPAGEADGAGAGVVPAPLPQIAGGDT